MPLVGSTLVRFSLVTNAFTGTLPDVVGSASNLRGLYLSKEHSGQVRNNDFSGSIPEALFCSRELRGFSLASAKSLVGSLPEAVASLQNLLRFHMGSGALTGSLPSFLFLPQLQDLDIGNNRLQGTMPDAVSKTVLQRLLADVNHLTGTLPQGLAIVSSMIQLDVQSNYLRGSVPDELPCLPRLNGLNLRINKLSGSLPDPTALAPHLKYVMFSGNKLVGTIPQSLTRLEFLSSVTLCQNHLSGQIPDGLGRLHWLRKFMAFSNRLTGTVPESVYGAKNLRLLQYGMNRLHGSISDRMGDLRRLQSVLANTNSLTGTLPGALAKLTALNDAVFFDNHLVGEVPDELFQPTLLRLLLGFNHFQGTFPEAIAGSHALKSMDFFRNSLTGTIPEGIGQAGMLSFFNLAENRLTGTIPSEVGRLQSLSTWVSAANDLEGELPHAFGTIRSLNCTLLSFNFFSSTLPGNVGDSLHLSLFLVSDMPGIRGSIPQSMSRLAGLQRVNVGGAKLTGYVPSFSSTLTALVLQDNRISGGLPEVKLTEDSVVMVWKNELSCKPPALGGVRATLSLGMLGNRFSTPRAWPAWVQRHERSTFFTVSDHRWLWLLMKVLGGTLLLVATSLRAVSVAELSPAKNSVEASVISRWLFMLRSLFALQGVIICPLILATLNPSTYTCVDALARLSAYLVRSGFAARLLPLVWALQAFWMLHLLASPSVRPSGGLARLWREPSEEDAVQFLASMPTMQAFVGWNLWLTTTVALALPVALYTVASTVPDFMEGAGTLALWVLSSGASAYTAVIVVMVLPRLSVAFYRRFGCQQELQLGIGRMVTSWLLPVLMLFMLDGHCWGSWTRLWRPCQLSALESPFEQQSLLEVMHVQLLTRDSVCGARSKINPASCCRSVVEQFSVLILGKMAVAGFLGPWRYLALWLWQRPDLRVNLNDMTAQLATCLEVAIIFGPLIPLLFPLQLLYVSTSWLIVNVARHRRLVRIKQALRFPYRLGYMAFIFSYFLQLASMSDSEVGLMFAGVQAPWIVAIIARKILRWCLIDQPWIGSSLIQPRVRLLKPSSRLWSGAASNRPSKVGVWGSERSHH